MGLFDGLFSPQAYGGQGGGLLDMLRNLQTQPQIQPSAGFEAPASNFAQRFEPVYDQPSGYMKVGDYNMPQFGPRELYQPQQAQLPANATPTQGQLPPQQQMQPQPPQELPPALGGGGQQNGFIRGLQSLGNGGGLISALTGNYNDPVSIQRANLKAQFDALVPLVGPQKAMLAIMNPEAGKTILAQALEKKQYGFTKLDNDTIVATDPTKGTAQVAYGGGPRQDTIPGPDGKPIQIPAGLDSAGRKAFIGEVARAGAKVAAGERTEVQAKSEKFGNKMEQAESQMKTLEGEGKSMYGKVMDSLPGGVGNFAQSEKFQKFTQAKNNFITALLRDESGAAIGTQEFSRYERELFPQPGDSLAVINQKREARRVAIEAMKKSAGPGYKSPAEPSAEAPDRAAVEAEMRRRGLLK